MVVSSVEYLGGVLNMSANLAYVDISKRHSYQHLHGVMLVNFNRLASKLRLSHTEYRIMGILIGLWNKNTNNSFPSINYLTELCRMSKATIIKNLKQLEIKGLININKTQGKRNNYYLGTQIINFEPGFHAKPPTIPSCKTTHDKQIKNKTNKKISSINQTQILNDDAKKIFNHQLLVSWGVSSSKQLIKQYGQEKVQLAIQIVQEKKPNNYGAYLRTILKGSLENNYNNNDFKSNNPIDTMLKSKFWKHIPTKTLHRVKPDIGNHLFIKYNNNLQEVTFLDTGFTDCLSNFEPSNSNDIEAVNKTKPSKKKVLSDLLKRGHAKEAMILKKVWKIRDEINV